MMLWSRILLIFVVSGLVAVSLGDVQPFLGRGIFAPKTDLLGTINEDAYGTARMFNYFNSSCYHVEPVFQTSRYFSFYQNTQSFYSSVTTSSDMSASFQSDFTLKATLQVQTAGIAGSNNTVTGNSLVLVAKSKSFALDKTCIVDHPPFTSYFSTDLSGLPIKIDSPWSRSSWSQYDAFLQKYGSHIITQITTGSEMDQRSFSKEWHSYSERDFEVKSCIGISSPGNVSQSSIGLCSNVTSQEIQAVNGMEMSTKLTVNGGTNETRAKLLQGRTDELIQQFLSEANQTDAPIRYKLTPIWDIIKETYIGVSDNFVRAVNMEAYYLGYMNFGCDYQTSGGVDLQMFGFNIFSTDTNPQYECTLAAEGCHSNDDCHYHVGVWCSCSGDSCVGYKDITLDTGVTRTTTFINHNAWGWHGCDWKVWGSVCDCYNSGERLKVWPTNAADADVAYAAHNRVLYRSRKPQTSQYQKVEL